MASKIKFYDDGRILISDVRLSYEHIFTPWAKKESEKPKFSGRFWMGKDTHAAEIKLLQKHVEALQKEHFKGKIKPSDLFFRDGLTEKGDETDDVWVIAASEAAKNPPQVVDRGRRPVEEKDGLIYSGCYVNVLINPWKQDNEHGKKLNANLLVVQFFRKGEAFSNVEKPEVDEYMETFDDDEGEGDGLD